MHVIFSGINVSGRQYEILNTVTFKKIKLTFEVGLPVNETQFSKTKITKNDTFSHMLMLMLVNIDGNQHRQNRCVF